MQIANGPMKSAIGLTALALVAGCNPTLPTPAATATEVEREICIQWRDSLPSRSRSDTERTQQEIGYSYDVQGMVCPAWAKFPGTP